MRLATATPLANPQGPPTGCTVSVLLSSQLQPSCKFAESRCIHFDMRPLLDFPGQLTGSQAAAKLVQWYQKGKGTFPKKTAGTCFYYDQSGCLQRHMQSGSYCPGFTVIA